MNKYLEKIAVINSISRYVRNVTGSAAAENAKRIAHIQQFVANNGITVPKNTMRGLHRHQRVLERARDKARLKTGVAAGAVAGGIAAAGTYSYASTKSRLNNEQKKLESQFSKMAAVEQVAGAGLSLAKSLLRTAKTGAKAVGKGLFDIGQHATGGKINEYTSSLGVDNLKSLGYRKIRGAVRSGASADKITSLVSRYGDKSKFSSLGQVRGDIKSLQFKQRAAKIGILGAGGLAAGAAVNKVNKPSTSSRQYYY